MIKWIACDTLDLCQLLSIILTIYNTIRNILRLNYIVIDIVIVAK